MSATAAVVAFSLFLAAVAVGIVIYTIRQQQIAKDEEQSKAIERLAQKPAETKTVIVDTVGSGLPMYPYGPYDYVRPGWWGGSRPYGGHRRFWGCHRGGWRRP